MKLGTVIPMMLLLLAGCARIPSSIPLKADTLTTPDVKSYSAAFLDATAKEFDTCTNCSHLKTMTTDYGVMRDQARAERGDKVDIAR